jgi:hypothetical protein
MVCRCQKATTGNGEWGVMLFPLYRYRTPRLLTAIRYWQCFLINLQLGGASAKIKMC